MAQGVNYSGKVVLVGDQVSIIGIATAVSGVGVNASITVQGALGNIFTALAGDIFAPEDGGLPSSTAGTEFPVNSDVTVNGTVTSITGAGQTAQLTVKLFFSGNSVVVNAGSVYSSGH